MNLSKMTLVLGTSALLASGCYENVRDDFPPGFEPWETNMAVLPAATAMSPCPEEISFQRLRWQPPTSRAVNSVHARACIHAPIATVWQAVQDPQVGRDHTTVNSFQVIDPPMASECDGDYQTQINAGPAGFTIDFRLCWRHSVAEGMEDAPTLTATRWQKVWGSNAVSLMEGSLVTRPLEGHPEITVVEYQYHLDALTSNYGTIEDFLRVIYGRLRDRAHDRMLP